MKNILNKRLKYIGIIIVLFLIVNITISLAYIRGSSSGSESISTVALTGGQILVRYSSNTGSIDINNIKPGYEGNKQFTITSDFGENHDYYVDGIWYTVALIIEKNEFDNNSIQYSLSLDNSSDNDGITLPNIQNKGILQGTNTVVLGSGRFDTHNKKHVYNLKISYPDNGKDQSHEIGREFNAYIDFINTNMINLTFDLYGGSFENSKLNSNSTIKAPANSVIDFPIPKKGNYVFAGWEDINDKNIFSNVITTSNADISLKALYTTSDPYEFDYTGAEQQFIAQYSGYYKIETWGAQGAGAVSKGGYTSGELFLQENEKLYVYVGQGNNNVSNGTSFNSGTGNRDGTPGGGATDIRLIGGEWNNIISLRSRIIIAGGSGSGSGNSEIYAGAGGGLIGYAGGGTAGGTQTSFGDVQYSSYTVSSFGVANGGCAGGNGFYPGGGATCVDGAGGGSSYISGHTGCVAIVSNASTAARTGTNGASCATGTTDNLCSVHYSGKIFTNTVMIDGAGYSWTNTKGALEQMPNPSGGYYASGVGHAGNGYARITFLHT